MAHDSTWLIRTRAAHRTRLADRLADRLAHRTRLAQRTRLTASIALLFACTLFAGLPAAASASTPEIRGEWELSITTSTQHVNGKALIVDEPNAQGEFASSTALFEGVISGTFSGTITGSNATVKVTTKAYGPIEAGEFTSSAITIASSGGSPSMSGQGMISAGGGTPESATFSATQIRTYKQIEEQEAKEKQEREEQEARENIRGEWSLTVKAGPDTSNGIAIIKTTASPQNKFTSSTALFEAVVPGTFSGTLEGATATVTVASEAYGPVPATEFTGEKITVNSTDNSLSISGTGKLYSNKVLITESATLIATRTKTYAELTAREAKEKLEREAEEKAEREAKEKLEREKQEQEAKAKAELEAKAKAELEAKTKAELEAKAKAEAEAKTKAALEAKTKAELEAQKKAALSKAALTSVELNGKTFTASAAGLLSLQVTNPNPYAISGRITLVVDQPAKAGKASAAHSAGKKALSLGTASFGISPSGRQLVKLVLSQSGRTELTRHKTLRVLATVLTKADGQAPTSKTLTLTLRAGKAAHRKG